MTKETAELYKKVIDINLRGLAKMVSKDYGIRLPRLKFYTELEYDNDESYYLYIRQKNNATLRKCRRNKLLRAIFDDARIEGFVYSFSKSAVTVMFTLKIKSRTKYDNYDFMDCFYAIDFEDKDGEITTGSIKRI